MEILNKIVLAKICHAERSEASLRQFRDPSVAEERSFRATWRKIVLFNLFLTNTVFSGNASFDAQTTQPGRNSQARIPDGLITNKQSAGTKTNGRRRKTRAIYVNIHTIAAQYNLDLILLLLKVIEREFTRRCSIPLNPLMKTTQTHKLIGRNHHNDRFFLWVSVRRNCKPQPPTARQRINRESGLDGGVAGNFTRNTVYIDFFKSPRIKVKLLAVIRDKVRQQVQASFLIGGLYRVKSPFLRR